MNRFSTIQRRTPLRAKKPWRPVRKPIKRTALKSAGSQLKRSPIRKVGKIGKANAAARRKIAKISEKKALKVCELGPVLQRLGIEIECMRTWPLAPAHRHKRAWYKGDAELLAHPDQWVCACQVCHDRIESDPVLTEEVFIQLRGKTMNIHIDGEEEKKDEDANADEAEATDEAK